MVWAKPCLRKYWSLFRERKALKSGLGHVGRENLFCSELEWNIILIYFYLEQGKVKNTHFFVWFTSNWSICFNNITTAQNILFLQGWRLWALWMPSFNNASSKSLCLSESGRCSIIPIMILIFQFANIFFPGKSSREKRESFQIKSSNCQD